MARQGYAEAAGERELDLNAIAAPVFDADGKLAGIIGLQGPASRFGRDAMRAAVDPLLAAARATTPRRKTSRRRLRERSDEAFEGRSSRYTARRPRAAPPGSFLRGASHRNFQEQMARGDVRIAVTLACEDCKRRNYQTEKSKRNDPERIELRKYCRWCGHHTAHKETR